MNITELLAQYGFTLRKTGNLYQLRGALGTVRQDTNPNALAMWAINNHGGILYGTGSMQETDSRIVAQKFGRVTRRP